MNYLENNDIKNYVIEQLINKLDEYEDQESYGCDLYNLLYDGEYADGVIFYSTFESKNWIKEHFEDLDEIVDEINFQCGNDYLAKFNPFKEPDRFVLIIITEVASYLLGQCKTVEENWDENLKLTKENIIKIKNELEKMRD